ncbi:LysR family transcriptional regulator [Gilvimarinus sp. SDUM040013]|uniref:LysR family transcriptional regulator n=1 Tax=Gilvimarinus gilvus TaxID=3058038 RepID=A0ABU4S4S1_9GAMM|nr:LysR family transcriptional regulator [Gilvimarinus sp. SDUM040013]MDO3384799.1 LysR family transcriptional regulator [Gilvimarinus sp. SDUM040013]MDX6850868.1 LysR family transcriptional regulator [Gilvimarinus sp. SDUM040013]
MDKLRAIRLFVRLAETMSFTAVAQEYGVTASMVSKEISKLEKQLNARLLHRTTRNLTLTALGEGYLSLAQDIVKQDEGADALVQAMQGSYQGKLRINAPMALGLTDLGDFFADFMRIFPDIELDIHLGDEDLDLVEHGFDLGFRASSRSLDSHYVGKPLRTFPYCVCASPEYLQAHGLPHSPTELAQHNCFVYSYFKGGDTWPLDGATHIKGTLRVNSTLFMRDAVEAGLGIGFMPEFVVRDQLARGSLTEILIQASKPELTLYALYPNRRYPPPALLKCIEHMTDWFN